MIGLVRKMKIATFGLARFLLLQQFLKIEKEEDNFLERSPIGSCRRS